MKKDELIYLDHIRDCISRIRNYTTGMDEKGFMQNQLVQDAVIRNFEIIGEAAKKLDEEFRSRYAEIEWKKIAGARDKPIHDYIGVDLMAVWGVLAQILPVLELNVVAYSTGYKYNLRVIALQ
jgi:uncharacterized protein with HEPN domain